jgi:hypothetical protein
LRSFFDRDPITRGRGFYRYAFAALTTSALIAKLGAQTVRRQKPLAVRDIPWVLRRADLTRSVRISWLADGTDQVAELVVCPWPTAGDVELSLLQLSFQWTYDGTKRLSQVALSASRPYFGGQRLWFVCPMQCFGSPCGRRCSKLYLPLDADSFGCRFCHDLTYAARREAHKYGRAPVRRDCDRVRAALPKQRS